MINAFFSYLIKKQIWVSFCFTMLALFFQVFFQAVDFPLLMVLFLSTISMYNLAINPTKRLNLSFVIWVALPLVASIIIGFIFFNISTIIGLACLALLSTQYSVPMLGHRFREKGSLKIFIISFVWASSIIIIPLLEAQAVFSITYLLLWLSVFLFTFAISIPFDLRDMYSDSFSLQTFPQKYGTKQSLKIANIFLVLSAVFFLMVQENLANHFSICFLGAVIYSAFFFKRSAKFLKTNYVGFWVEAASLVPILLYSVLQVLK